MSSPVSLHTKCHISTRVTAQEYIREEAVWERDGDASSALFSHTLKAKVKQPVGTSNKVDDKNKSYSTLRD